MVKINKTFIIAILSMGITIVCFAVLLKILIPPIISKESVAVFLAMILMLNVEYIILLKSYELDMLCESRVNQVKNDSRSEKEKFEGLKKLWVGKRTKMSTEEINAEIQKHREERIVAISPGVDDEQFNIHTVIQPLYDPIIEEPVVEEPVVEEPVVEEPELRPKVTTQDIVGIIEGRQRSMKDIIEEAEKQLEKTLANKPEEKVEIHNEPVQEPIIYGDQPVQTGKIITEKPKPKTVTKRKAVLRKKR
jgi:hypothetical protein